MSESLDRAAKGGSPNRGRVADYLKSVRGRLREYSELVVLDAAGQPFASTAPTITAARLPADWAKRLRAENHLVGDAYWDDAAQEAQLTVAIPVERIDGRLIGALAAKVRLAGVQQQLQELAGGTDVRLFLATTDGKMIVGSSGSSSGLMNAKLKPGTFEKLSELEGTTNAYRSVTGEEVVGGVHVVPRVPWAVVAEIPADTAFRAMRRFQTLALLIVLGLLVATSIVAYRLGLIIVRPLDRLTKGASEVAGGDLAVDLPSGGGGEVGYLTYVFNYMVKQLRAGRAELDSANTSLRQKNEELERLSSTDVLTGLSNRRQLMHRLEEEITRSQRNKNPFTVLMADVDHFKSYNDQFGHQAGDAVLKAVGDMLRKSTRGLDCAARYGGEEFCVLLPEATTDAGKQVAERMRSNMAEQQSAGRTITVSIGIAEFPRNGESLEAVIASADAALYEAKRAGRDRVVTATPTAPPSAAPPKSGKSTRSGRSRR